MTSGWYNYDTGKREEVEPKTAQELMPYVPPEARQIFTCIVETGIEPLRAYISTLGAAAEAVRGCKVIRQVLDDFPAEEAANEA